MAELSLDKYHTPIRCEVCGDTLTFMGVGEYKCDKCGHLMYDDYGVVRNYLEKNKGVTVVEISMATGISQSQIKQMLKEDRLEISDSSRVFLRCEACGKEIKSGRYCPACEQLAAAAEAKKRANALREERQMNMAGFKANPLKGEEGTRRFKREH
ncbi:MAG: hypothetical protein IKR56_04385 [Lachnospiraceae bacterium]|nr:hypothetical protein [Lachnospiraceae bacterium]MBR4174557.1 hypothetical protein [Lachnospiraceae bacterium]